MRQISKFYIENELLFKEYRNALRKAFKHEGISISVDQWLVLSVVGQDEGISQKEISVKTAKEPAAIMRMLDLMTEEELIARIPTKEDRRKYQIILSNKGREIYKKLTAVSSDVEKKALEHLDYQKLQELNENLRQIKHNLSN